MSDLLNEDELSQLKEIMEDEFEMLTTLFIDDSAKLIADMNTAIQTEDREALRIAAHTLKGSSANMCVPSLSYLSSEVEERSKNMDLSGITALIEKLTSTHTEVADVLKKF
ncbi:MAG: Hpt domain-containing protein [Pseudomonadota bacterium]